MFGLGLQVWTSIAEGKKRKTKQQYNSRWKKKLIIQVDDYTPNVPLDLRKKVIYIKDIADLNYFICDKPYCFYGTIDYRDMKKHELTCTSETKMTYKQVKREKKCNVLVVVGVNHDAVDAVGAEQREALAVG